MTMAHRIEVVLSEDGKVLLDQLPFRAGQAVEIIILPANRPTSTGQTLRACAKTGSDPLEFRGSDPVFAQALRVATA
jgi:hypothetical protein